MNEWLGRLTKSPGQFLTLHTMIITSILLKKDICRIRSYASDPPKLTIAFIRIQDSLHTKRTKNNPPLSY